LPNKHAFIAHHIFDHYYNQLIEAAPELKDILDDKIRIAAENPLAGEPLQGAPQPLQGRIRKLRVRKGGRRLFYIHFPEYEVVLGVFITPESRKGFNYAEFPWALFEEAADDFNDRKLENFRIIDTEEILKKKRAKKKKRKKK